MTAEQLTLFAIFPIVLVLMIWGRWRYDMVAFAGLIAGVLTGIVPAREAFSGFANPATMTVALILITTAGLQRSGVVAMLTRLLSGAKRSVPLHVAIMGSVGAFISGFMNNVAALAILMPIDIQTARRAGRSAALTLMPLAFATILGGMTTLIGTPPNLLVSQFREAATGGGLRHVRLPAGRRRGGGGGSELHRADRLAAAAASRHGRRCHRHA